MSDKLSWRTLMETRTEKRTKIQTPALVAVIVGLHVMAVGSIIFIQGCGRNRTPQTPPTAPTAPVMPPAPETRETRPVTPPVFQPPAPIEHEPRVTPPPPDLKTYEVQRGDSLSTIAQRHGVTTAGLADLNQITDRDTIRIGQKLLLPAHARATAAAPAPATRTPAAPAVEGATYVVQAGDSLSRIAQRHGVSASRLAEANNISDPNLIRVGQTLVIPGAAEPRPDRAPDTPRPSPSPKPAEEAAPEPVPAPAEPPAEPPAAADAFPYTVRTGDTLETIARDFAILKEDILNLNNLSGDEVVTPGQTLLIPPMR